MSCVLSGRERTGLSYRQLYKEAVDNLSYVELDDETLGQGFAHHITTLKNQPSQVWVPPRAAASFLASAAAATATISANDAAILADIVASAAATIATAGAATPQAKKAKAVLLKNAALCITDPSTGEFQGICNPWYPSWSGGGTGATGWASPRLNIIAPHLLAKSAPALLYRMMADKQQRTDERAELKRAQDEEKRLERERKIAEAEAALAAAGGKGKKKGGKGGADEDLGLDDDDDDDDEDDEDGDEGAARFEEDEDQIIDFFVTHAWDHPPAEKIAVLLQISADFEAEHGRKPRFFIDKFSADPADVVHRSITSIIIIIITIIIIIAIIRSPPPSSFIIIIIIVIFITIIAISTTVGYGHACYLCPLSSFGVTVVSRTTQNCYLW
jgi:hypothetical protein